MTARVARSSRDDPLAVTMLDDPFDASLNYPPYPGLRPFFSAEWPIFFGRETMTDEIIDLVTKKHLVVVHGDSGSGKSSIVRAGCLVQLQQGHAAADAAWRTCAMLPREDPLGNLARALAGLLADEPTPDQILDFRHILNRGRRAPKTLARRVRRGRFDHICILVDQFEELFSFAKRLGPEEARLFVDLLIGLQQNPPPGLYAILTMRSEFLGHCARFEGLAEAVNKTQYLLPRMERPALLRAIREPATLYGGEVSQELAERLIVDAGGGQNQLPLIQHGLMLLWRRKAAPQSGATTPAETATTRKAIGEHEQAPPDLAEAAPPYQHDDSSESPARFEIDEATLSFRRDDGPVWHLGLEDYRGVEGLATLLSDHAEEVLAQAAPDPQRQHIAEHLFRALTDINAEGQSIRRPQTFAELVAVTGSDEPTLQTIIDQFRADGVFFLTPYGDAAIEPGTLIDIGHEALIRSWRRLSGRARDFRSGWVAKEVHDGLQYRWLHQHVTSAYGKPPSELIAWWGQTSPNRKWAERYGGDFDRVSEAIYGEAPDLGIVAAPKQRSPGIFDVERDFRVSNRAAPDPGQLVAVSSTAGANTYQWWKTGLDRAMAVASIRQRSGSTIGTGFLVRAADLGLELGDELLVMTAFYIVNEHGASPGIKPEDAEVVFEAADPGQVYSVDRIVWSSPIERHDASLLRLRAPVPHIRPLPLARALPVLDETARVYIIGHPGGRDLAFSFQDNELLDHEGPPAGRPQISGVCRVHYRAPTEPGSGGSPVFNAWFWEVIALHHRAAKWGMLRLNGKAGEYAAKEGISIQSIKDAIAQR
jgi:Trypsin-like peptidase domain